MMTKIYPRTGDNQTVYLNAVIKDPQIEVGDYTIYNDFVADPLLFEKNNVLYHYPLHTSLPITISPLLSHAVVIFDFSNSHSS